MESDTVLNEEINSAVQGEGREMISIVEQIFTFGREHPEKNALLNGRTSLSYKELMINIISAKNFLENQFGLTPGNRVIIAADNQIEFVPVYFACHLSGVITLPIAPDTNESRYRLIKSRVNPALVIGIKDDSGNCPVSE